MNKKAKVGYSSKTIMARLYHNGIRPETANYIKECAKRGLRPDVIMTSAYNS